MAWTDNLETDPTQPDIARELARTAAVCRSVAAYARGGLRVSARDAALAVSETLSGRVRTADGRIPAPLGVVVISAVAELLHTRVRVELSRVDADSDAAARCRELDVKVASGELAEALAQRWHETQRPDGADIASVIETLVKSGLDGERLAAAIADHEALRHERLVRQQANKVADHFPDRVAEDLFGWGWMGLRAAMRGYDPDRGFRFSTYAATRIVGAIRDGVRAENPVPKRLLTFSRKVQTTTDQLQTSLGRVPTLDEVADEMRVERESLEIMPRLAHTASIDEMAASSEARGGLEVPALVDAADPADAAIEEVRRADILEAIRELPEQERAAVYHLVWEGRTLTETERMTGIAARTLRQHRDQGCSRLSDRLAGWAPTSV